MKDKKRIFAIIQARMTSARLIGKVVKEILGKPVLGILVERIKNAKMIDGVIVATTTNPRDDIIEKYCIDNNINVFRGSEEDVMDRMLSAAKAYDVDIIIEQGADCPLNDIDLIDGISRFYLEHDYDYVTTLSNKRVTPHGYFARICSTKLLEKAYNSINDPAERAKGFFHIENNPQEYRIGNFILNEYSGTRDFRITIDTQKDLEFMSKLLEGLGSIKVSMKDIVKFIKENPELLKINKNETHMQFRLYKIGVIDNKNQGFNVLNYDSSYKKIKDYELAGFKFVALVSQDDNTKKENARKLNISRCYNNYKEMLKKEDLDILILYGDAENIQDIEEHCKSNNVKLIVDKNQNFNELIEKLYKFF